MDTGGYLSEEISLKDYGLFLVGQKEAIRKVCSAKQLLEIGGFMVVSAGIARTAWLEVTAGGFLFNLFTPFLASIVSASILYAFIVSASRRRWGNGSSRTIPFRSYLGIYWLTAPLAWFYGFPAEPLWGAKGAFTANMVLLLIVALWRVALIMRILSVMGGWSGWQSFLIIFRGLLVILLPLSLWGGLVVVVFVGMAGNPQLATDGFDAMMVMTIASIMVPVTLIAVWLLYFKYIRPDAPDKESVESESRPIQSISDEKATPGNGMYIVTVLACFAFFVAINFAADSG